jgi:hypothetical protein
VTEEERLGGRESSAPHEIYHMNVVALRCSVRSVIVRTVNLELLVNARRHALNEGHKVIGNALRVLPNGPAWVCAYGVEIAQRDDGSRGVCHGVVAQNNFRDVFCLREGRRA